MGCCSWTRWKRRTALGQDTPNHARRLDPSQALVEALGRERQSSMVDAAQVQHRRVQVMHRHRVLRDVVAEVVRLSVVQPPFDSTACEPAGKTTRVVVATIVFWGDVPLTIDRPSKFTHEDDQRIFKKSP